MSEALRRTDGDTRRIQKMPTLNLFTNVPLDAVTASDILRDATKAVAKIIGKPESVSGARSMYRVTSFFFFPFMKVDCSTKSLADFELRVSSHLTSDVFFFFLTFLMGRNMGFLFLLFRSSEASTPLSSSIQCFFVEDLIFILGMCNDKGLDNALRWLYLRS